jgi:hypothetical protein
MVSVVCIAPFIIMYYVLCGCKYPSFVPIHCAGWGRLAATNLAFNIPTAQSSSLFLFFDRCVTLPILHAHPKYMSGVLFLFIDAHELSFLRRSAVSMLIPVKPSSLVIC